MEVHETLVTNSPALWMPAKAQDAWELKQQFGTDGYYIAGGTLIQTNWAKGKKRPLNLISLDGINELHGVGLETLKGVPVIRIGALATLNECLNHPELLASAPLLGEAIKKMAAPAVRNRATIGGNIASKVGDAIASLLAMDASILLFNNKRYFHTSLAETLQTDRGLEGQLLICVYIPIKDSSKKGRGFYKKIGYREAFSPSVTTVSGCYYLNEENLIEEIFLAAGDGLTPTKRLYRTEQTLMGAAISNETLQKAYRETLMEYNPIQGASIDYKKRIAANIITSEIARLADRGDSND